MHGRGPPVPPRQLGSTASRFLPLRRPIYRFRDSPPTSLLSFLADEPLLSQPPFFRVIAILIFRDDRSLPLLYSYQYTLSPFSQLNVIYKACFVIKETRTSCRIIRVDCSVRNEARIAIICAKNHDKFNTQTLYQVNHSFRFVMNEAS